MSHKTLKLPKNSLFILAAVEQMGREMIVDQNGDAEANPLDFYGESYMESLSEAGYSETRPNNRLSIRAFGKLVRVNASDLATVKNALGWRKGSVYHDFAIADNVQNAIGRNTDFAAALPLLAPAEEAKAQGPFYPGEDRFDVDAALAGRADLDAYLKGHVDAHKNTATAYNDTDKAVVALASIFQYGPLCDTVDNLKRLGVTNAQNAEATLAYVILDTLRKTPRFVAGLRNAQAPAKSAPAAE